MTDLPTRITAALKATPVFYIHQPSGPPGAASLGSRPLTLHDILVDYCALREGPQGIALLMESADGVIAEVARIAAEASSPPAAEPSPAELEPSAG